ncbi:MAG: PD-(D/E)XK nuclease family protein [Spirochaetes bacterium]|nr:PD-(D/E)XK nuclease family protein [Spirochaetota bacterium]
MLTKSIFISPTRERARDFARQYDGKGFLQTFTLQEYVYTTFASSGKNLAFRQAGGIEESLLLEEALKGIEVKHFGFLKNDFESYTNTAAAILQFFYMVKSNHVDIKHFKYPPEKLHDLERLFDAFEKAKRKRNLVDYADIQLFVLDRIRSGNALNGYETIYYDKFEQSGIHLWGSGIENEIYEEIRKHPKAVISEKDRTNRLRNIHVNRVFSRYNEIEEAARIAKTILITTGCDLNDIVIAAGRLDKYLLSFEQVFAKYELPVFVTQGMPLYHFPVFQDLIDYLGKGKSLEEARKMLMARYHSIRKMLDDPFLAGIHDSTKGSLRAIENLIAHLRSLSKLEIRKKDLARFVNESLRGEFVYHKKPGIHVQELNQLVHRQFEHVILIGVDSENIPLVPSGNFLYGPRDMVSVFGQNNSWLLSAFHIDEVFTNNTNVYVVKAGNEDRMELKFARLLVDRVPDIEKLDPYIIPDNIKYRVLNKEDILSQQEPVRVRLDDNAEKFIASLISPEFTAYDGIVANFNKEMPYFSVSQFNTYAKCPLQYFFSTVLKLKEPSTTEGFDPMQMGTIAHACFEMFGRGVIDGSIRMPASLNAVIKKKMKSIAEAAFREIIKEDNIEESIEHRVQLYELTKGLDGEPENDKDRGVLLKFLDYVYNENNTYGYMLRNIHEVEYKFEPSEFDIEGIPMKGFIDRVDIADDRVILIDYKPTKKVDDDVRDNLLGKMTSFKEFQLPVYSLLANKRFNKDGSRAVESFLLTFKDKGGEFSRVSYKNGVFSFEKKTTGRNGNTEVLDDPDYEKNMKNEIKNIVANIRKGDFRFSLDEDACEWCGFVRICRKEVRIDCLTNLIHEVSHEELES